MLFGVFILGISAILLNTGVNGGNQRPQWVSVTGFQGAGTTGQDAGANGYAGGSLVSPLSASGFNSPLSQYPSTPQSNPSGAGFGGYQSPGAHSTSSAGGQGSYTPGK